MPVFIDVKSRLDVSAAQLAAREAVRLFTRAGEDISKGFSHSISKGMGAFDASAMRAQLQSVQAEYGRLAAAEEEAARRMVRANGLVEVSQKRLAEVTAKYTAESSRALSAQVAAADAHAIAARETRAHVDAMVAAEVASTRLSSATGKAADTASRAGQVWNAVGVGSVAAFGAAMVSSAKAAGDFEQSQQRLVASAGESQTALKQVSDGILQMAGQVGYSAQELSQGMYSVEKAGYRGSDALNVLRSAAQLAKAENADLKEVLSGLTTSMHDFGYGEDQAAAVASKMNVAVGLAKTTLQEFSGALHSVEPIAAAAGLKLEDVYGSLAQVTQSGTSADQAAQNMAHSISQLMKPTQQMREEMAQLGVDARDVQAHLGDRGYAGTVQMLSETIKSHMNPAQQVVIDTMFKSQQATDAATQMFNNLPPAAQKVAESIKEGTLSFKDFRKSRGGLSVEDANLIGQWANLNNKVEGFSNALKTGQGDIQTYEQALALMTGGQDSLRTVLQLVGDNYKDTESKIGAVKQATADADGTVKGFTETQQTMNAKMADFKASMGAAKIELGNAFLPIMKDFADVLATTGGFLANHKTLTEGLTIAVGALGTAWLGIKAYNIAETILSPIVAGLGRVFTSTAATNAALAASGASAETGAAGVAAAAAAEVTAEEGVTAAALEADAAMAGGGAPGGKGGGKVANSVKAGARALPYVGAAVALQDASTEVNSGNDASHWFDHGWGHGLFGKSWDWFGGGHAAGGAIHGAGAKGHDSVPAFLAPGEHVLTHHDVSAMGGHGMVYSFRNALHRQYGGSVGPDVQVAQSMVGHAYSQGSRWDCSGSVGRVILGAMGLPANGLPTTVNMGQWLSALGFRPGTGGPGSISVGWYDHGGGNAGHAAMTLSDGENAESGGSHGSFLVGAGAAGANSAQFDHHMFLQTPYGQGPGGGMPGMGGFGGGGFGGGGGGGGGIPAGGVAGVGPGGQSGYYTASPEKVASAQERLRHLDEEIANAEQRKKEMKGTAKQSERDRLDEEIKHLQVEREQAQGRLAEAEKGTFHAGRGGAGGGSGMQFGNPLPSNFGLGKGLPGVAEWLVTFLTDLALAPAEAAIANAMGMTGGEGGGLLGMASGALGGAGGLGTPPGPGDFGFGAPALPDASGGGGGAGVQGPAAHGGGGTGPSGGGGAPGQWWGGWSPRPPSGQPGPPRPGVATPIPGGKGSIPGLGSAYEGATGLPAYGIPQQSMPGGTGGSGPMVPRPGGPIIPPWDRAAYGLPPYAQPKTPPTTIQPGYGKLHFATGGPSGTDTIPAWLSPGEFVMNADATSRYLPDLQSMNAQYFDGGTGVPLSPTQPTPGPAPGGGAPGGPPPAPPGQGAPGTQGAKVASGPPGMPPGGQQGPGAVPPINIDAHDPGQTPAGLAEAGQAAQQPGATLPQSPGIGFGGGLLGAAEGAASQGGAMALDSMAPGAGQAAGAAMQLLFQEANRAAAYGAQAAGIGVEGIIEALTPDTGGSDWATTIPGRVLMGVSGVRPSQPNTAGNTQPPLPGGSGQGAGGSNVSGGGQPYGDQIGMQVHGDVNVHAQDPNQFQGWANQQSTQAGAMMGSRNVMTNGFG